MMKRYLFTIIFTICFFATSNGDSLGDKALMELSQRVKALGHYGSKITITIGENVISGHYSVSDKNYHIDMGNIELWGDAELRYEVSHKIEEVVISKPSTEDNTLLGNPTAAFDFVGQEFNVEAKDEIIRITPKADSENSNIDAIEIWIDESSQLPTKILYRADGDTVEITISKIKSIDAPFQKINLSKYKKYDIVELF